MLQPKDPGDLGAVDQVELMATRPLAEISIRQIAAHAGLPHTLIYRHVGSKADLERAVIERTINEVTPPTDGSPADTLDSLDRLIATLLARRDSVLVLINSLLFSGTGPPSGHAAPVVTLFAEALAADIAQRAAAGAPQPPPTWPALTPMEAFGAATALIMGWVAFEPRNRAGTGLSQTPTDTLATLARALLDLGRPASGQLPDSWASPAPGQPG